MTDNSYQSDALEALTGLEPVRRRPGMYTDTERPNHLVQEVVDNSVDEAMAGHANLIQVTLFEDGSVEVEDNGRGMPVDINQQTKMTGVAMIMEMLHSGAKFSNKSYKFSGGLHGVGVSVVNAMSEELNVYVKRNGLLHHARYLDGHVDTPLYVVKGEKLLKSDTGTRIRFKPNPKYFDTPSVNEAALLRLLKGKAILCPGLQITVAIPHKSIQESYHYEDGLSAFLDEQSNIDEAIEQLRFIGHGEKDEPLMQVDWGCYFTESSADIQQSYTNLIPTIQGGTHVSAFRSGLFDGLKEYGALHNLIPKNVTLSQADFWGHVNYVLSLKMQEPQFAGQTKERLSSRSCAGFVTSQIKDAFSLYLNANATAAATLMEMVVSNAQKRMKLEKKVVRKEIGKSMRLPGKLSDCDTDNRDMAELFIVEGDSAGGSAKQARNRNFQAILPLRGKILNTWEIDQDTILQSKEIADIATAIGVDPGSSDLSGLRYGKICILADADSDGLHIATLFAGLMLRHFPILIEQGHIFVAMPPLYRIDAGKQVHYALDEEEKLNVLNKLKRDKVRGEISVQRFKGLGEMNPGQLAETTLDPVTRRLVQMTMTDPANTFSVFDKLLKKNKANERFEWLTRHGDSLSIDV